MNFSHLTCYIQCIGKSYNYNNKLFSKKLEIYSFTLCNFIGYSVVNLSVPCLLTVSIQPYSHCGFELSMISHFMSVHLYKQILIKLFMI